MISKIFFILPVVAVLYYLLSNIELVDQDDLVLERTKLTLVSEIYDRHGDKIGEFVDKRRYFVGLATIPQHLIDAFVSAEDKKFFRHRGIDYFSVLRAMVTNLVAGEVKQGASTITQQLARMLFLNRERTWLRKSKEAQIAQILERKYDKQTILEYYLNMVYLGNGAYGVEAASRSYFRKPVQRVNLSEAALLAVLPRAPSALALHRNYRLAKRQQRGVLRQMFDERLISRQQYLASRDRVVKIFAQAEAFTEVAPYFSDQVYRVLRKQFSLTDLKSKGYQIYTSLDQKLQNRLAQRFHTHVQVLRNKFGQEFQAAFFVIDSQSGEVLAVQGGSDYRTTQFNRALQTTRHSQRMLLPFILATIIDSNLAHQQIGDVDPAFVRLYRAMFQRTNRVNNLIADVGHGSLEKKLKILSIDLNNKLQATFTLANIVTAFATFANQGYRLRPRYVREIKTSRDQLLFQDSVSSSELRVFSRQSMSIVNEVLEKFWRQDDERGFAGFSTNNSLLHDSWSLAYNNDLVVGVWLGAERGRAKLPADRQLSRDLFRYAFHDLGKSLTKDQKRKNVAFISLKAKNRYLALPVPL